MTNAPTTATILVALAGLAIQPTVDLTDSAAWARGSLGSENPWLPSTWMPCLWTSDGT